MNSFLAWVFPLSRFERAVWSEIETASSVDLEWVKCFWDDGVDVSHDQPFKALHGYRHECYRSVVI
jgi:hypothetical protein